MSDQNHFPEIAPQDELIDGHLVPHHVMRDIRQSWIAGVALSAVYLLGTLALARETVPVVMGLTMAAALALLSMGVYRRSRVCAVLLMLAVIGAVVWSAWRPDGHDTTAAGFGAPATLGWVPLAIALYFLAKGIRGTVRLHRLMR